VFLSFLSLVYSQTDCTNIKGPTGLKYNISAVVGKELRLVNFKYDTVYRTTICKNSYEDCGLCTGLAGFCQNTAIFDDCLGKFTHVGQLPNGQNGVEILYTGGDYDASARIQLNCDPNAGDIEGLHAISENYRNMIARSKHACPVVAIHKLHF